MRVLLLVRCLLIGALLALGAVCAQAGDDFPPVNPQELAMKDDPLNPGAPAIILYREEFTDDSQGRSSVEQRSYATHVGNSVSEYVRIKILTEAGKDRASVEVPYFVGFENVDHIKARTVEPDGTIKEFDGQVFDKVLAKKKGLNRHAKTFTFPDVRVGSILEYKYQIVLSAEEYSYYITVLYVPEWIVQRDLFTRKAHFEMNPGREGMVRYNWWLLPANVQLQKKGDRVVLDIENIPAFEEEAFEPPVDSLVMRVRFFYLFRDPGPDFWKDAGKELYKESEGFIGKRGGIAEEGARVAPAQDPPETRLRKLYARSQQLRNLSFEHSRTEQEIQRSKQKENDNAEDVLKRGYGEHNQINRLFAALARAAGFQVAMMRVEERDQGFFSPNVYDISQLNRELAVVQINGQGMFFDPGTPRCPFGLLPWQATGVDGLLLAKDGGSFGRTPDPKPADGMQQRTANLQLSEDGSVEGKVTVSWQGQQALEKRLDAFGNDDAGRRKMMEDTLRQSLPQGAVVNLTGVQGWDSSDGPLTAEASVEMPNFAARAGRRLVLPLGLFQARTQNPFAPASRKNPIYFNYPFQSVDDVTLRLPAGVQVESLPAAHDVDKQAAVYHVTRSAEAGSIHMHRSMTMATFYLDAKYYSTVRWFYNAVGVSDAEQAVLQVANDNAAK